jgi:hypothetical protein
VPVILVLRRLRQDHKVKARLRRRRRRRGKEKREEKRKDLKLYYVELGAWLKL